MPEVPSTEWRNALDLSVPLKDTTRHNEGIDRIQKLQQACLNSVGRSFHAKQLLGAFGELKVRADLPDFCKRGPFLPGATYRVAIRFSNAQGCPMADAIPDIRGVALKFLYQGSEVDLVMTNTPASVTPDAGQFMDFGHSYAEGAGRSLPVHLLKMVLGIARRQSFQTALSNLWRIITNILRPVKSMAREKYWGAAVRFDQYVAKYTLQPAGRVRFQWVNPFDKDYLSRDLTRRVENGGLTFRLGLQFFLDRRRTPLHVAHEKWHGPIYWVADVTVRPGSGTGRDAEQVSRDIDKMPFNPTHWFDGVVTDFQASRGEAYRASHRNRGASSLADYAHYFSRGCGSEHGS